jgi:hypothetical protein
MAALVQSTYPTYERIYFCEINKYKLRYFFELTTFKMTFCDRIVVREIDVRALLCGRRPL